MLNHISSQCNKSFILSLSRQDPLMVDCYTDVISLTILKGQAQLVLLLLIITF